MSEQLMAGYKSSLVPCALSACLGIVSTFMVGYFSTENAWLLAVCQCQGPVLLCGAVVAMLRVLGPSPCHLSPAYP